jgi:hypothetical protein
MTGNARRFSAISVCFFMLAVTGVLAWYFVFFTQDDPDPIAMCGDCHCIVAEGEICPAVVPSTNYTKDEIDTWGSQTAVNPYQLSCNPYEGGNCETEPPQDESLLALGEDAVCAMHFEKDLASDNQTQICEAASYRLVTYASFEEAETAGGFVTHTGHCGVCSTMQDLAAYLKSHDLTTQGKFCAKQGALSLEDGRECYRNLGMTKDCAEIWADNSWNTATDCFADCVIEVTKDQPNNGPAPDCKLNDCLQCDENKSGQIFQEYAGRTRRRSGLLSAIARPCDQLVSIDQIPCPQTTPLEE